MAGDNFPQVGVDCACSSNPNPASKWRLPLCGDEMLVPSEVRVRLRVFFLADSGLFWCPLPLSVNHASLSLIIFWARNSKIVSCRSADSPGAEPQGLFASKHSFTEAPLEYVRLVVSPISRGVLLWLCMLPPAVFVMYHILLRVLLPIMARAQGPQGAKTTGVGLEVEAAPFKKAVE